MHLIHKRTWMYLRIEIQMFSLHWMIKYILFKNVFERPIIKFHLNTDILKAVLLLWIRYVMVALVLLCFRARLFIDALWPPARKGLTSCFSFVMSNREVVVTFPLVSNLDPLWLNFLNSRTIKQIHLYLIVSQWYMQTQKLRYEYAYKQRKLLFNGAFSSWSVNVW